MLLTTLISVDDLAPHIQQPNWVILDCRHDLANPEAGRAAYDAGHIPGAQFAHLDTDLAGAKTNHAGVFQGRHPLPERAEFIARLRAWGVNPDSQVVVYDAHSGMFAARLWWMLRWVGHATVAVLDGGLPAWVAAHHAVTQNVAAVQPGTIADRAALAAVAHSAEVAANLKTKQKILVDARSPDRFRGENETMDPIGGHIPGAKNRFFKENLQADGSFKAAEQLHAELSQLVGDAQQAIMQCGSGVTACHNLLALEVAGMPGAALYPGSWSEWCSDPAHPVEVGPVEVS